MYYSNIFILIAYRTSVIPVKTHVVIWVCDRDQSWFLLYLCYCVCAKVQRSYDHQLLRLFVSLGDWFTNSSILLLNLWIWAGSDVTQCNGIYNLPVSSLNCLWTKSNLASNFFQDTYILQSTLMCNSTL